jgi:hypothetical protein
MLAHLLESSGLKHGLQHIAHELDLPADSYDKFNKQIVQDIDGKLEGIVHQIKGNAKDIKHELKESLENGDFGFKLKQPKDDSEVSETKTWKVQKSSKGLRPDATQTVPEIIKAKGFGYEDFEVTTKDGYELTVMHVKGKKGGPVVFLMHGLFSSAETWILNGDNSVAFLLANAGFDVWMGNNRGSLYSRKNDHIDPDTNPKVFINYSFYESGLYDAPKMIDLVLLKTGKQKLAWIGHSQGTSQMFSALSENVDDI